MNIFTKFCVLHGWASQKTKRDEGFVVMCKIEKYLIGPFEHATEEQISLFKKIVSKKLTKAEIICLRCHFEEMIEIFTADGNLTHYEEQYCNKHCNVYRLYLNALLEVL